MLDRSINEKIEILQQSETLSSVPLDILPPVQYGGYYFVSYSHLDYKEVYCDILRLQEQGINIWYDRGLPPGKDWERMANEAISRYSCLGVIFYLSKNALLSDAVLREIQFVQRKGKDYLSINLPLNKDENSVSASNMLEKLAENHQISSENRTIIENAFNDKVLFIDYSANTDFKVDKIKLLKQQPNIQYEIKTDGITGKKIAVVDNIIDLFASEIKVPETIVIDDNEYKVKKISDCAFSNCKFLTDFKIPKNSKMELGLRAFYGCESLENIDLSDFIEIGDFAFACCSNLKNITLPSNVKLGNGVFSGTNLNNIQIIEKPGETTLFAGKHNIKSKSYEYLVGKGNLKKYGYKFGENVLFYDTPDEDGFLDITNYKPLNIDYDNTSIPDIQVFAIGDSAFANRNNLNELRLSKFTRVIGDKAFEYCENLKEFMFITSNKYMQFHYGFSYTRIMEIEKDFINHPLIIGNKAFNSCIKLEKITLPPYVKINEYVFANCINLKTVKFVIHDEMSNMQVDNTYIGEYAFSFCKELKEIAIPKSIAKILEKAFYNCKNLETINIEGEGSLKIIDKTAFLGCESLKQINYDGYKDDFLKIEQIGKGENLEKQFIIKCLDGIIDR